MKNQRLQWLDIAKGITIILMVLGHTSIPKVASNFIWAFHMPLFFIASGLTTNWVRESYFEFAFKKASSIMRPFIGYSLVMCALLYVFNIEHPYSSIFSGWGGYALWFVPVLFVALLLAKLFFLTTKSIRYAYLLLLPIISFVLRYNSVTLPWNMSVAPYGAMFLILGSYVKPYTKKIETSKWWLMALSLVITFIISHFWRLDMCYNSVIPMVPLTIGAISGTFFIFTLSVRIEKMLPYVSRALQAIGRETFLILAFSQIIIQIINTYFGVNTIVKYLLLVIVLLCAKYVKDIISKMYRNLLTSKD